MIRRWSGTRCIFEDNLAIHTYNVIVISYLLCSLIKNYYNIEVNIESVLRKAIFHDSTDIILTHIIAPVKNYNYDTYNMYQKLKGDAFENIIKLLPLELQGDIRNIENAVYLEKQIIEIADNIDVYCKSFQEIEAGNKEFLIPYEQAKKKLDNNIKEKPYIEKFRAIFLESFEFEDYRFRYLK